MGLSLKQVRYLYAIGVFKKNPDARLKKTKTTEATPGTNLQYLRQVGKIGKTLKPGETSTTKVRIGGKVYGIQKHKNDSSYLVDEKGKLLGKNDWPEGKVEFIEPGSVRAKRIPQKRPTERREVSPPEKTRKEKEWSPKSEKEILSSLASALAKAPSTKVGETPNQTAGKAVFSSLGFDKKPEVISDDEFDQLPGKKLYRGFSDVSTDTRSAKDYLTQFTSGELYVGRGIAGVGIYSASSRKEAEGYISGKRTGVLIAMALKPDAKVISWKEAEALHKKLKRRIGNDSVEPTVVAAAAGYDAIDYEGFMTIVMNRGALRVRKSPLLSVERPKKSVR